MNSKKDELLQRQALLKAILDKKKNKAKKSNLIEMVQRLEGINCFPASYEQRRLGFIYKVNPDSIAYNICFAFSIYGDLKDDLLQEAINEIGMEQESLRTRFKYEGDELMQVVEPDFNVKLKSIDLTSIDSVLINDEVSKVLKCEVNKPFDLENGPLIRFDLIKKSQEENILLISVHHIIFDGWSTGVLFGELSKKYNRLLNNEEYVSCGRKIQYADYSQWQKKAEYSEKINKQLSYWKDKLKDIDENVEFPIDKRRPPVRTENGDVVFFEFDEKTVEGLKKIAINSNCTISTILLAAFNCLVYKYTNQNDITVGTAVANRTVEGIENIIGFFVNTLVLSTKIDGEMNFFDVLEKVKRTTLEAYENSNVPFDQLVEEIDPLTDRSRNPFFQLSFNYINTPRSEFELNNLRVEEYALGSSRSTSDVALQIEEKERNITGVFEYNSDLFYSETIKRICNQFKMIVSEVIINANRKVDEISILSEEEKNLILNEFNNTHVDYDKNKTVVDVFEEQVKDTSNNVAVVFENEKLTYKEINERANNIAAKLREKGVRPNDFVALIAKRSLEMIVGILGIIKSGAAYVPIDPKYPRERIEYIISDCKPKMLVTYKADIEERNIPIIDLNDSEILKGKCENLEKVNKPDDLLYVIYTSGTTGRPKGVMIEHRSVINFRLHYINSYNVNSKDKVLQFFNIAFDGSVSEWIMSLLTGASLYVIDEDKILDINFIEDYAKDITIASFPPQYFQQLKIKGQRFVITAGSEANTEIAKKAISDGIMYVNAYGPTETTVCATEWACTEMNDIPEIIPIGKPIENKKIYILNGMNLCGIGIPGELCIAGDGIAKGYLNNEKLTNEKFIKNIYGEGRVYRTGDLARWLPDGNIEYLGRIDDQVKIRGFRIELTEIENVLRKVDKIKDAVVIVKQDENGDKAIYSYMVSDIKLDMNEIKDEIGKELPSYMIPAYMMQIDEIPVTLNGKIDKKSLPDIEEKNNEEYVKPRNKKEEVVCKVFEDIFNQEKVGINKSFFELGGDSIKAIRAVSKVRDMGYKITVKDIMEQKTITKIANTLKEESLLESEQGDVIGKVIDTPILKWFKEKSFINYNHFNQALMIRVKKVNKLAIKDTLDELVNHHDMLRARYENGSLNIHGSEEAGLYEYKEYDLQSLKDKELEGYMLDKCNEIQSSMKLENSSLVKTALFIIGEEAQLLICMHHIIIDGVSWRILLEDFETVYRQKLEGKNVNLPLKTTSYKKWAEFLQEYANSNTACREIEYWTNVEESMKNGIILSQKDDSYNSKWEEISFDKETTRVLIHEAGKSYGTEINDLLLSALIIAINRLTKQERLSVELESHGREKLNEDIDIDRTVGWFTSSYPVVLDMGRDLGETIINTKEMLRRVPSHGIKYGILRYISKNVNEEETSVSFNYLGEFDSTKKNNDNLTEMSSYSVGESIAEENDFKVALAINGQIINEQLGFRFTYDSGKYEDEFILSLKNEYYNALKEIIEYCTKMKEEVKTASDFNLLDWSNGEFEEIFESYEDID